MPIDLVVVSRAASGYLDEAWNQVHRLLEELGAGQWLDRAAGIRLIRSDQVTPAQLLRLEVSAGAILSSDRGPLHDQLVPREPAALTLPHLDATRAPTTVDSAPVLRRPADLFFDNGTGGFSADGREYVIHLEPGESTPAPWCNVLANDDFGCLVTERGGGYTWAGNSGEFRLTPWTNDPVLDPAGESLYLRDEETVEVWSPTPGPAGSDRICQVRHGAGYSEWRQNGRGLACRVRIFVPVHDPVKIVELSVRNHDPHPRRITLTYAARWLLGRVFEEGGAPVVVDYDATTRSLRGRNPWNPDFAERVAFMTSDREPHGWTTDRTEFLGREGDAGSPAALHRVGLSEAVGARMDPCAVLQVHLDLRPGEEMSAHFVLGRGLRRRPGHGARRTLEAAPRRRRSLASSSPRIGTRCCRPSPCEHRSPRWTCCSTAGRSTRCSRRASSGARASINRAVPSGSATSSRTCSRSCTRIRFEREPHPRVCEASIRRRRRAALVASTAGSGRTHALLRRSLLASLCHRELRRGHRRPDHARRGAVRSSPRRRSSTTSRIDTRSSSQARPAPHSSSIVVVRSSAASPGAPTACR